MDQIEILKGKHEIIIFDAPLLLENKLTHMIDSLWVVACPLESQISRVMARDQVDEVQARNIISRQMPLDEKIKLADKVINNDSTIDHLYKQVDALLESL